MEKKFKLLSNLASLASVKFYDEIKKTKHIEKLPSFDCRIFSVPNKMEAWNSILWRVQDSIRNSIQSLGQDKFSHKELNKKNQKDIIFMLDRYYAISWSDLPSKFKEGMFVRKKTIERLATSEELGKGSENKITRNTIEEFEIGFNFSSIENRIEFLFENAEPIKVKL